MQNKAIKPWHQQPWLWFLISIPLASVILSSIMVFKAIDEPDTLISANYYKDGLAINKDLSLDKHALDSGMSAQITSNAQGTEITVALDAGTETAPETIILKLEHPTRANSDKTLQLSKSGDVYKVVIAEAIVGKRYLTISSVQSLWQIRGEANFPSESSTTISPTKY